MPLSSKYRETIFRKLTIGTLYFMVAWGFVVVLAQVRPFWVDEWRVIYNLKYKSAAMLFGPLDYMQQFPRVYLQLINAFAFPFDYSYFTLRLPSFLVGTAAIWLCYRLMTRMYPAGNTNRFLFVMILVSSYTFTEYYVQIKQYTMEILLSLVAIYQLLELLALTTTWNRRKYILLCTGFFIVPFFSYTYPIAVAPVFIIVFLQSIPVARQYQAADRRRILLRQWFPLFICGISIGVFYITDVAQVMADGGMKQFWGHLMMKDGFSWQSFFVNGYTLFAQVGSGLLFSIIFGIVGICAFVFGVYKSIIQLKQNELSSQGWVRLYAIALLVLVLILFCIGKFPVGEPRLNAFTVPAISILIIYFLGELQKPAYNRKLAMALPVILFAGVTGNIYTSFLASVSGPVFTKKLDIYVNTENAIIMAQEQKIPILITPAIAYPFDGTINYPFSNAIPGDWVLKAFPAYKVKEQTPVYALNGLDQVKDIFRTLPPTIKAVMAGDGRSFRIITRP